MIIPRYLYLTVIVVSGFGLWGCVYDGIFKNGLFKNSEQLQEEQMSDSSVVLQTLEPATESPQTESPSPEVLPSESMQQELKKKTVAPAQSGTVTVQPTDPEATRNSPLKR